MPERGAVVITGASRGIGEACALRLDRGGFRVFAGVRREADGTALQGKASGRLTPILLDVISAGSIAAAADAVAAAVADVGLAGLVNNAGIGVAAPLEFLPIPELRRQFEVNVVGQIAVTQAFLPLLRRGCGRIINVGSASGRIASPFIGPYAASKFALEALTDSLRVELFPWGIEVLLIEPGNTATSIWETSVAAADEMVRQFPPQAHDFYGRVMAAVRRRAMRNAAGTGMPADAVAKVVERALVARRPKTRYLVGTDARLGAIARYLPDRMRDRLMLMLRGRGRA